MKHLTAIAAIVLCTVSCRKETVLNAVVGDNIIAEGTCVGNIKGQGGVSLCFNKLVEDSRCPVNTVCFWRGAAVAEFTLNSPAGAVTFKLADLKALGYNNDTTINNIHLVLKEVTPAVGEEGYASTKKKVRVDIQ